MTASWVEKAWDELDRDEVYAILALRQRVFIVEQTCPYLDTERPYRSHDGRCARRGSRRAIEGCVEAVSGRIDLAPLIRSQMIADQCMVSLDHILPGLITKRRSSFGRVDDVRE